MVLIIKGSGLKRFYLQSSEADFIEAGKQLRIKVDDRHYSVLQPTSLWQRLAMKAQEHSKTTFPFQPYLVKVAVML